MEKKYLFTLFVDSLDAASIQAVEPLQKLCDLNLGNSYSLEVIDLQDNVSLFEKHRIIAVPTLDIQTESGGRNRFVGDMSMNEKVINTLGMRRRAERMKHDAVQMLSNIHRP